MDLNESDISTELIISVFIFMGLGGVIRELSKKTGLPYTPTLFFIG